MDLASHPYVPLHPFSYELLFPTEPVILSHFHAGEFTWGPPLPIFLVSGTSRTHLPAPLHAAIIAFLRRLRSSRRTSLQPSWPRHRLANERKRMHSLSCSRRLKRTNGFLSRGHRVYCVSLAAKRQDFGPTQGGGFYAK